MLMEEVPEPNFLGQIYVYGSSKFFGIKKSFMKANNERISTLELKIYSLDGSGRFYHCADIPCGYTSFVAEEFFCARGHGCHYDIFGL